MRKLHRPLGVTVAGVALMMASCASVEPPIGIVSLTQEAMAASAKLEQAKQAGSKEGARAAAAADAVATWRGESQAAESP